MITFSPRPEYENRIENGQFINPDHPVPKMRVVLIGDYQLASVRLLHKFIHGQQFTGNFRGMAEYFTELHCGEINQLISMIALVGDPDYSRARHAYYTQSDLFLLVFHDDLSYTNLKQRWIPEIYHFSYGTPFIIVRTEPLPSSRLHKDITRMALRLSREMKAGGYCEANCFTGEGVYQVFETALKVEKLHKINKFPVYSHTVNLKSRLLSKINWIIGLRETDLSPSIFEKFPDHIIKHIVQYLSVESYLQFKYTCKKTIIICKLDVWGLLWNNYDSILEIGLLPPVFKKLSSKLFVTTTSFVM